LGRTFNLSSTQNLVFHPVGWKFYRFLPTLITRKLDRKVKDKNEKLNKSQKNLRKERKGKNRINSDHSFYFYYKLFLKITIIL
jgi:hypothetical protein